VSYGVGECTGTRVAGHPFILSTEFLAQGELHRVEQVPASVSQHIKTIKTSSPEGGRALRQKFSIEPRHASVIQSVLPAAAQKIDAGVYASGQSLIQAQVQDQIGWRQQL